MSHIVKLDIEINDLEALKAAAESLGLEFREGQKRYRWYGQSVGDYPLPEGVSEADLGHCDHALSIPGNKGSYEVGVVAKKDGSGYHLLWDFWNGGFGLQEKIGADAGKLKQAYTGEVVLKAARAKGFKLATSTTTADGKVQLHLRR
jgi:hypothetical protein